MDSCDLCTETDILFCAPQQYYTKLSERAVAYINVDIAVFGNYSLSFERSGRESNNYYENWVFYAKSFSFVVLRGNSFITAILIQT